MYYHLPKDMLPAFLTLLFQEKQDLQLVLLPLVKRINRKKHSFQTHPFILLPIQAKQKNILRENKRSAEGSKIYHQVCQTQEGKNIQQDNLPKIQTAPVVASSNHFEGWCKNPTRSYQRLLVSPGIGIKNWHFVEILLLCCLPYLKSTKLSQFVKNWTNIHMTSLNSSQSNFL